MKQLNWVVYVSQSGGEVFDICRNLDIIPKLLITNNIKKLRTDVTKYLWYNGCDIRTVPFNPQISDYLQEDILGSNIITLHGYLRILPAELINSYSPRVIYNGHPAPITLKEYPELKGKDPVERLWKDREKYGIIGTVIHEVTEGVDEGNIVCHNIETNTGIESKECMYLKTRELSLQLWIKFFKDQILKLDSSN